MEGGFPIVHVFSCMREAHMESMRFRDEHFDEVLFADYRRQGAYVVELNNEEKHIFLSYQVYGKWLIGRTYVLDGEIYHSGIKL